LLEGSDGAEESGFARAVGANESEEAAGVEGEGDIAYGGKFAELDGGILDFEEEGTVRDGTSVSRGCRRGPSIVKSDRGSSFHASKLAEVGVLVKKLCRQGGGVRGPIVSANDARGVADDGGVGGNITDDDGTAADDDVLADGEVGEDGSTDADEGAVADGDGPGEGDAGGDMDVITDGAIVVDGGAGIDDAANADGGVSGDDGTSEDDGPVGECSGGGDISVGMDQDGEVKSERSGLVGEALTMGVVADGDHGVMDTMDGDEGGELGDGAEDGDAVEFGVLEFGAIVNDTGEGADGGALDEFQEDARLTAGTVDYDCHRSPPFTRLGCRRRVGSKKRRTGPAEEYKGEQERGSTEKSPDEEGRGKSGFSGLRTVKFRDVGI
jgi:hypothetical protein